MQMLTQEVWGTANKFPRTGLRTIVRVEKCLMTVMVVVDSQCAGASQLLLAGERQWLNFQGHWELVVQYDHS